MDLQNVSLYTGFIADIVAIIGIPFTVWRLYKSWQRDEQMQQEIAIELHCDETDTVIPLPVNLKRSEFSRAEVNGYLGMVVIAGNRYDLSYLRTPAFFQELKRIQASNKREKLIIPCEPKEIAQFQG